MSNPEVIRHIVRIGFLVLAVSQSAHAARRFEIGLGDYKFNPAILEVTAGEPVELALTNRDIFILHNLTLSAGGIDLDVDAAPGKTENDDMTPTRRILARLLAGWLFLVVLPASSEAGLCSPHSAAESPVTCCDRLPAADNPGQAGMDYQTGGPCVVFCLVALAPSTDPLPGLEAADSKFSSPCFRKTGRTVPPDPFPPKTA